MLNRHTDPHEHNFLYLAIQHAVHWQLKVYLIALALRHMKTFNTPYMCLIYFSCGGCCWLPLKHRAIYNSLSVVWQWPCVDHLKVLACPSGVSTVRLPLASWSFSMASKRDLKFPAPKPWMENRHTQMANYPEICLLLCHLLWLWGSSLRHRSRVFNTLMLAPKQQINTRTGSRARRQRTN